MTHLWMCVCVLVCLCLHVVRGRGPLVLFVVSFFFCIASISGVDDIALTRALEGRDLEENEVRLPSHRDCCWLACQLLCERGREKETLAGWVLVTPYEACRCGLSRALSSVCVCVS